MPCQKSVLVGYFVCHEKCDTTLPFFLLIPMGKPLSATSKPQPFQFIAYLFFSNSSSFTTSLLNFCFTGRKSQQTAVSGNTACFFNRQMCQWLLLRNACSCLCIFCCHLNGVFCLFVCLFFHALPLTYMVCIFLKQLMFSTISHLWDVNL